MYFASMLTQQSHALYLPRDAREAVARLVATHQRTKTTPIMTPFRRQVDFWLFCIAVALSDDLAMRDGEPRQWGHRFVDTREVQLTDVTYDFLAVVAFEKLGRDPNLVIDPAQIIDVANRLAGAACESVLAQLTSNDLKLTPLDKALVLGRRIAQGEGT